MKPKTMSNIVTLQGQYSDLSVAGSLLTLVVVTALLAWNLDRAATKNRYQVLSLLEKGKRE